MATDNQAKANNDVETIAEDDWGAAMAEQQNAEAAGRTSQSAVFTEFSGKGKSGEMQNDIDFILDIPVQLTVIRCVMSCILNPGERFRRSSTAACMTRLACRS